MTTIPGHVENHDWIARKGALPRVTGLPPAPLETAARFPEIETGPPLSRCGDHVLYSARVKEGNAPCLVLFVEAAAFRSPEHLGRFLAGMAHIGTLTHPHLLTLLWTGERGGHVCLGYEAFEGTSLFDVMDRFTLAPRTVVGVTGALGSVLQLAHDQGIIYRDLTPGGVLLNRAGFPKLAGLGLGILLYPTEPEFFQALLQRPRYLHSYLAPEQVNQQGSTPDHLTDIYALGVITYEMLVGHPPSGLAMPPSARAAVGTYVDQVVFRAVHSSREERYASAAKFGADIQSIYAAHSNRYERDRQKQAEGSPAAARRKARRLVIWAVAGLLAAGAGAALLLHYLNPGGEGAAMANQAEEDAKSDALQAQMANALSGKKDGMTKAQKEALLAISVSLIRDLMLMAPGNRKTEAGLTMIEMLMQAGEEDLALETLLNMGAELPPDSVDWRRIEELTQLLRGGRAGYQSASTAAAKARKAGDARQERMELAKASGYLPGRVGLKTLARQNLYDPVPPLQQALRKMRNGAGGRPVRYAIRSWELELHVDLAGNPGLSDLTPLSAFPITHLDLSRTGVSNLRPLTRLPLQVLRLDQTPVTSLTPVTTGCMRVLTAEDCLISDLGSIDQCLVMTGYRVTQRNGSLYLKTASAHWGRTWVNTVGGTFLPLSERSPLLVARNEVLVKDLAQYARSLLPGGRSRLAPGSAAVQRGPIRQPADFPATRLTASEAVDFCVWLTERERSLGRISSRSSYRLLTPEEWNQAAGLPAAKPPGGKTLAPAGIHFAMRGNLPPAWDPGAAGLLPGLTAAPPGRSGTFRTLMGLQDLGNGVREWGMSPATSTGDYPLMDLRPGPAHWVQGSYLVPESAQAEAATTAPDLGVRLVLQLPPVHALNE